MEKEFKLSEKEYKMFNENGFKTKDVKELIRLVKIGLSGIGEVNDAGDVDSHMIYIGDIVELIDKLSGLNDDFPITAGDIGNGGIE